MEVTEKEFLKAVLNYFKAFRKSDAGWTADYTKNIIENLEKLVAIGDPRSGFKGRENMMVQIGKNFGIYGLKIQPVNVKKKIK